jgi:uncharacterized membrane protein YgcG
MSTRCCSRNSCREPAVATLTYVYATSTAVVGPLAISAEPHAYDLCQAHARSFTIPRGWELVRHDGEFGPPPALPDDLAALAEAVREPRPAPVARSRPRPYPDRGKSSGRSGGGLGTGGLTGGGSTSGGAGGSRRRDHLRIVQPPA